MSTSSGGGGTTKVNYSVIYFPFLIIAFVFVLVAIGGKCKDSTSQVLGVIIAFWGLLEFFLYIVMAILAFRDHGLTAILAA